MDPRTLVQTKVSPQFFASQGLTAAWAARRITTFRYLLELNCFACRSYEQLHLYPVFPNLHENDVIAIDPEKYHRLFFAGSPPTLESVLAASDEELTPEFFFMFEAFAGLVADPLTFVYRNCVALEDWPEINLWIDKVFGVLQTGCFPRGVPIPRLFVQPHPPRSPPRTPQLPPVVVRLPTAGALTRGFVDPGDSGVVVHCFTGAAHFQFTCRGAGLGQVATATKAYPQETAVLFMQHSPVFVSPSTVQFPAQAIANPSRSADFVDCDGAWLVCGNDDGYFYAMKEELRRVSFNVLPHYPAVVTVSAARNLVCVGTTAANILVFELDTGKIFEVLELGAQARAIVVTHDFGFIVAFCENSVVAFTENGTEMYRKDFPYEVAACCSARTYDGRDYVVVTTAGNEIACFEAFQPEVTVVVRAPCRVVAVTYSDEMIGLCFLTEDGAFHFQPFRPG
jgi:hypothetical protein